MATKRNGLKNILQILSTLRQKEVEEALMSTYIDFLNKKHLPEECISLICIQDIIGSKARMILKRDQMVDHLNENCIPHSIINKPHQHRFHDTFNSIEDLAHKQVWYPVIRSPRKKVFHVTQNGQETKLFDDERYKNCSTQLTEDKKYVMTTRPANSQTKRAVKNCNTQTHKNVFQPKKLCFDKSATTNVEKKNHHKQEAITENSVLTIENKIDTLIQAMNDFMNEINLLKITNSEEKRRKKCNTKSQTPAEELIDYNIKNHRNIVSYTYLPSREQKSCKLEETVVNTHKANFDNINKNSSIQIKFKVSTRDHCTEISRSLSRQITNCKIIADTSQTEKTTIALNTDPISFRALLKISSEAIRGFFSLDFLSYVPYLQLPRLEWSDPRPCLCDTNVNVDKITNRFLKLAPVGPYKCQYCDEVFDKAYSWERHEFYCARTLKAVERKCGMFRVC
ncbi:uncharacterized protein LOC121737029 isoform X2 [Aricia agestis]|nr:uncharacterized protein LOC121737029 isoform X2 [Aricia agestis]